MLRWVAVVAVAILDVAVDVLEDQGPLEDVFVLVVDRRSGFIVGVVFFVVVSIVDGIIVAVVVVVVAVAII